MNLLFAGDVSEIIINDADRSIYAFWKSVTEYNSEFLEIFDRTPATMEEWYDKKHVQDRKETAGILELGFSTFFLNRTNRSGILTGGVIGGKNQEGNYKMDARYNRPILRKKIEHIGELSNRIEATCKDAVEFITDLEEESLDKLLLYIDPPYYNKGSTLYMNYYEHEDHLNLSRVISHIGCRWIMSYDDVPEIREIYKGANPLSFKLRYSSYESRLGKEIFYCSENLSLPEM